MFRALLIVCALVASTSAMAQETFIGGYGAMIGPEDHYNSKGVRLKSVAAIIRQDRANFHRFGIRHAEDEYDPWFDSPKARQRMERALIIPAYARDVILQYSTYVYVSVYGRGGRITSIRVEIPG